MKISNAGGYGFKLTSKPGEQQECFQITGMTYDTPYQIPKKGMLVKTTTLSTAYDATATPTQCVASPCTNGGRPNGWAYIDTRKPHPLNFTNTGLITYPLTADIGGSGYAESKANWVELTVLPLIPGQLVGFPVYASTSIAQGAEIASATGGYVRTAVSTDVVIGFAEWPANNSTGSSGDIAVSTRVVSPYTKA